MNFDEGNEGFMLKILNNRGLLIEFYSSAANERVFECGMSIRHYLVEFIENDF